MAGDQVSSAILCSVTAPLLTFDDGPSESTVEVLDLLAAHGLKAVFYVIGARAAQRPELVARAASEGHVIGNHTWDHVRLTGYNDADVLEKLRQTNEVIGDIVGAAPTLFRGPRLDVDERVLALATTLGLTHMGADVDTADYSSEREHDAKFVAGRILSATDGQIVLLHDGNGDEMGLETNPPRPKTVEALRLVLPEFASRWNVV